MKKAFALACLLVVINGAAALAQNDAVLGKSHFTAELDAMSLQHRTFDTDDGGVYFGLAGYGHLGGNWYLGGEVGVGVGFGFLLADNSSYMPIEVNAKRAFALSSSFAVAVGAGLSYSRVVVSHDPWFSDDDWEVSDWVLGGQVMGDVIFSPGGFLIGLKFKYQLTEDVKDVASLVSSDAGWDYSNLKIGLQIGFRTLD